MKYDLKRLREAMDREIPCPDAENMSPRKTAPSKINRMQGYHLRAWTAAAAAVMVLALLITLWPAGPGRDVREGEDILSFGATARVAVTPEPANAATAAPAEDGSERAEMIDPVDYQGYSPDWAWVAFPDEKVCGEVVIRKTADGRFAFLYEDSGEEALPGLWGQAFAYFPLTGTGLVGNGEGMALLGKDGLITEFVYDSFQYAGGGAAIVSLCEERKSIGMEGMCHMRIVGAADGEFLNAEAYDEVGVTGSEGITLLLGSRYERTPDGKEYLYDRKLYTDVMDTQGRVIVRGWEFWGLSDGQVEVRMDENSGWKLFDLDGNVLMDGMEFSYIGADRWGERVAWLHEGGTGVLDEEGNWVIGPSKYFYIDIVGENRYEVTDYTGGIRLINSAGEEQRSFSFTVRQLMRRVREGADYAAESMGRAGFVLAAAAGIFLAARWALAAKQGRKMHLLLTEAGWAALIAGLLFLSHRDLNAAADLWPTNTSTDGASGTALVCGLAAVGGLTAMLSSWKRTRRKIWAVVLMAAMLAGPWLFKAACSDMSVMEWRAASILIMGWLPVSALIIGKSRLWGRMTAAFEKADEVSEYTTFGRGIWQILALAAAVYLMLGAYLSGQELVSLTHQTFVECGAADGFDTEWMEAVHELREEYILSGKDEEVLDRAAKEEGGWEKAHAVRWMDENGIDRLEENMFFTVRAEGELVLKREARAFMYLSFVEEYEGGYALMLAADSPQGTEESLMCETVILLAPGKTMPELTGTVYINQPELEGVASQSGYRIDMGPVTPGDTEGNEYGGLRRMES